MQLNKTQAEFWAILLVTCIIVAGFILLVDFGIKGAILEESNALRLKIEKWERENGRATKTPNTNGVDPDAPIDNPISVPLLVDKPAGLETDSSPNGNQEASNSATNRRSKPRRSAGSRGIPT